MNLSTLLRAIGARIKGNDGNAGGGPPAATPSPPLDVNSATLHVLSSVERMLGAMTLDRSRERRGAIIKRLLMLALALMPLSYIAFSGYQLHAAKRDGLAVPTIKIEGTIGEDNGSARSIIPRLERAFAMPGDKVVLMINSPGGSPADAERVRSAIMDLKQRRNKTVHVLVEGMCASAAYMIALAGDTIYAGNYALVGSIGVIMQTWDASELANKNGLRQHTYASGAYKALGSPMHAPTEAERNEANELVTSMAGMFAADVAQYRGGKLTQPIASLATGQVWGGAAALKLGLIDVVDTPESYFAKTATSPQFVDSNKTGWNAFLKSSLRDIGTQIKTEISAAFRPSWN